MAVRKIVSIDEKKCNGCGQCIPNCVEGAIKIIDGKAKLVSDVYCDGLGACLGHCPQDAISVIEREADDFDEEAAKEYQESKRAVNTAGNHSVAFKGCPGSRTMQFGKRNDEDNDHVKVESRLGQWPVQLSLVSPSAPYFKNADLLVTADCVPFAYGNYHNDFLKDRALVVGCPKLDNIQEYTKKLEEIIRKNDLESITVLRMEVPCCGGMSNAVRIARDNSGVYVPIKVVTIGVQGDIIEKEYI